MLAMLSFKIVLFGVCCMNGAIPCTAEFNTTNAANVRYLKERLLTDLNLFPALPGIAIHFSHSFKAASCNVRALIIIHGHPQQSSIYQNIIILPKSWRNDTNTHTSITQQHRTTFV